MRTYINTEALVLARRQLTDGKKQVILFTPKNGKITTVAYGATNLTSHKIGHLEPGNLLFVSISENNGYFSLSQSRLIYAYSAIRADSQSLSQLLQICHLLLYLLPDGVEELDIYTSTIHALKQLNNRSQSVSPFLYQTLARLGYADSQNDYDISSRMENILSRPYPKF